MIFVINLLTNDQNSANFSMSSINGFGNGNLLKMSGVDILSKKHTANLIKHYGIKTDSNYDEYMLKVKLAAWIVSTVVHWTVDRIDDRYIGLPGYETGDSVVERVIKDYPVYYSSKKFKNDKAIQQAIAAFFKKCNYTNAIPIEEEESSESHHDNQPAFQKPPPEDMTPETITFNGIALVALKCKTISKIGSLPETQNPANGDNDDHKSKELVIPRYNPIIVSHQTVDNENHTLGKPESDQKQESTKAFFKDNTVDLVNKTVILHPIVSTPVCNKVRTERCSFLRKEASDVADNDKPKKAFAPSRQVTISSVTILDVESELTHMNPVDIGCAAANRYDEEMDEVEIDRMCEMLEKRIVRKFPRSFFCVTHNVLYLPVPKVPPRGAKLGNKGNEQDVSVQTRSKD